MEKILAEEGEEIAPAYLDILANYLIIPIEKQERRQKKILTDNHLVTINKRETSFEGLVQTLENGEDGIYNLIKEDKNIIFQPKISITKKDLEEIPLLRQLREAINIWDAQLKRTSGKDAYTLKKALIEMRKDQYLIKQSVRGPIIFSKLTHSSKPPTILEDKSTLNEDGTVDVKGFSFMNPDICSAILCDYSKLKQNADGDFNGDIWYLIYDFENLADKALAEYPLYHRLMVLKIDGCQNLEIQEKLAAEFGVKNSIEYISSLWRNKIPKLIAEEATRQFILWQYKQNNLPMKRCSRCGSVKPAHNIFFSKNKTSKDGWYSICKCCRNVKRSDD